MDSVAGIIMAIFIFSVAYVTIRKYSLILIEACNFPGVLEHVKWIAVSVDGVKKVKEIKLRKY